MGDRGDSADPDLDGGSSVRNSGAAPSTTTSSRATAMHQVLEALPDAALVLDHAGRVVAVNAACAELMDRSAHEVLGSHLRDLVPDAPGDTRRLDEYLRADRAPAPGNVSLALLRNPDGSAVPVEFSLAPLTSGEPDAGALVLAVVSNARLQRAFDAAQVGMSLVDARPGTPPRRLMANRALAEITGLPPDDLLDAPILESIDPRDRATVGEALAALHRGTLDTVRPLKARVIRPDGTERWVNVSGALVRQRSGEPDYVVANMLDVTDQVRAETGARAAQVVLRAALDASPDGFAVYRILSSDRPSDDADVLPGEVQGPRFVLTQINRAGAAMATDDRTLVGLTLEEILDDAEGSGIPGLLRTAVATEGTHRLRTSYASHGWAGVLDVVAVRVDGDHVLSTWRDVSAQVASENVLIEAYGRAQYAWDTLHLAIDATPDVILILEVEPAPAVRAERAAITIRHLNRVAAASTGLDRDDLIDSDLADAFPHWQATELPATIRQVAATGVPRTSRTVVDGPRGRAAAPVSAFEATVSRLAERRVIVISRDVTAQETVNRQIEEGRRAAERSAAHDPLTGLPNRARLEQHLRHALMTCGPQERVAVLSCDLDDLKGVNDTHGHRAGDILLKAVAARLDACLCSGQTVARMSGDEFVLVLPALTADWRPEALLDVLRRTVRQPVDLGAGAVSPSLTIGCYVADPATTGRDRDPADVIAAADTRMYQAKAARRPGP